MTVRIAPELEERVRAAAARRNLDAEAYVNEVLTRAAEPKPEYGYLQKTLTPEEWERSFREWTGTNDWPVLPDEALTRESFYRDQW